MFKKLVFLIVVVAAVALPVMTHLANEADNRRKDALQRRAMLIDRKNELKNYDVQLASYTRFADLTQQFLGKMEFTGVAESGWNRHSVAIKERPVPYSALAAFVAQTNHGPNSYFIPKKFEVRTGGSYTQDDIILSLEGDYLVTAQ